MPLPDEGSWLGRIEVPEGRDDIITITTYFDRTDGYYTRKKIATSKAVLDWCAENNIAINDLFPLFPRTLYFKTTQDAMLFKLRWL